MTIGPVPNNDCRGSAKCQPNDALQENEEAGIGRSEDCCCARVLRRISSEELEASLGAIFWQHQHALLWKNLSHLLGLKIKVENVVAVGGYLGRQN